MHERALDSPVLLCDVANERLRSAMHAWATNDTALARIRDAATAVIAPCTAGQQFARARRVPTVALVCGWRVQVGYTERATMRALLRGDQASANVSLRVLAYDITQEHAAERRVTSAVWERATR